jgi:CheY-like chemotaxis protein
MSQKAHILLVDDEMETVRPLAVWLQSIGYTVVIVQNGQEAIKRIKGSTPPEILLLDLDMPMPDGLMTLAKIRDFNRVIPIVMMVSGVVNRRQHNKARALGISGFFEKKGTFDELVEKIEMTLQIHKQYHPYSDHDTGAGYR